MIRRLKSLADKKARDSAGLMLVEGEVMIREALACGLSLSEMIYEEGAEGRYAELASLVQAAGGRAFSVPRALIESVAGPRTPQGVCASFRMPRRRSPEGDLPDRLVALNGVQDPGNVGTIWRTADAAGFGGLLMDGACADPFSPKVQRAAMGSGFRLPVFEAADMGETLHRLRGTGYAVVVSCLDGEPFYQTNLPRGRVVLVVGSEAHGVSDSVKAQADLRLKLPMRGGAESLNAAVAAGIMMYEMTKFLE